MNRTDLTRAGVLALTTAGCFVALGVSDLLTRDPVTGAAYPSEWAPFAATAVALVAATVVAVWRGIAVPLAIVVVPLASGVTMTAGSLLAIALGESDPQAPLFLVVTVVVVLMLVPLTGTVAALTLAVQEAVERRRSLR